MANKTVFTNVFRVSYPHLEKPQEPQNSGDTPKYGLAMMFPKSGILPVNNQPSNMNNIMEALDAVCMEQFKFSYADVTAVGMGVQFPPSFKDGDTIFEKDANGNAIAGQINPNSKDMLILSAKNENPIGCCDPTGQINIHPKEIVAGYWASAELECSAYVTKAKQKVVSIKVINVQLCYEDTPFGRGSSSQANQSFANRGVADSNITQSYQPMINPVAPVAPTIPVAPPVAPAIPVAPVAPVAPPVAPPVDNNPVIMNQGEPEYQAMIIAGWTNELIISHGKGVLNVLNPA